MICSSTVPSQTNLQCRTMLSSAELEDKVVLHLVAAMHCVISSNLIDPLLEHIQGCLRCKHDSLHFTTPRETESTTYFEVMEVIPVIVNIIKVTSSMKGQ